MNPNLEKQNKEYLTEIENYKLRIVNLQNVNSDQKKEINQLKQGTAPDKKAFIAAQNLDVQEEYLILEHRIKSLEDLLKEKEAHLKIRDDVMNGYLESSISFGAISKKKYDNTVIELNEAKSELIAKLDSLNKENEKITLVNKIMEAKFNKGMKDNSILEEKYWKLKQDYEAIKISSSKKVECIEGKSNTVDLNNKLAKNEQNHEIIKQRLLEECIKRMKSQLFDLNNKLAKNEHNYEVIQISLLEKDEYIEGLKSNIVDLNNKLAKNELLIDEKSKETRENNDKTVQKLLAQEQMISVLNSQIANKLIDTQQVKEKFIKMEEDYRSLDEELENYKQKITETEAQVNLLNSELTQSKDLIRRIENEKKMLNEELEEKEKVINKLQGNIEEDLNRLKEIDSLIISGRARI